MQMQYNGKKIYIEKDRLSLIDFLKRQGIEIGAAGVAVAHNQKVLSQERWQQIQIQEGDQIEVIYAVQGG